MATLDACAELVDISDGRDDCMGLGVDGGGVIACAEGAHGVGGVVEVDVIREDDRRFVRVSGLI